MAKESFRLNLSGSIRRFRGPTLHIKLEGLEENSNDDARSPGRNPVVGFGIVDVVRQSAVVPSPTPNSMTIAAATSTGVPGG